MKRAIYLMLPLLAITCGAWGLDKAQIDEAIKDLSGYAHGQSRNPIRKIELCVRQSLTQPELRAYLEEQLGVLLTKATDDDLKLEIAEQLWIIGPVKSLPALAQMLSDEKLSHIACYAIGNAGNPAADQALIQAAQSATGKAAIHCINTLGVRRTADAVAVLEKRAADKDPAVAEAAAAAIGRIGTPDAAAALARLRKTSSPVAHTIVLASLNCAEKLAAQKQLDAAHAIYSELATSADPIIRRGAVAGAVRIGGPQALQRLTAALAGNEPVVAGAALASARQLEGPEVTAILAKSLGAVSPEIGAVVLDVLSTRRNDAAARAAIELSLDASTPVVRGAAIKALGRSGDAGSIHLLVKKLAAAGDDEKNAAVAALGELPGGDATTTAIAAQLAPSPENVKRLLIRSLMERRSAAVVPQLAKLAADPQPALARTALEAMGLLGASSDIPSLLDLLTGAKDDSARRAAEQAIIAIASRDAAVEKRADAVIAAMASAKTPEIKASLVRVLGGIANPRAAEVLREAMRDGEQGVKDAALRALSAWPDTTPTAFLLNQARLTDANNLRRALAIRGALRQMGDAAEALKGEAPSAQLVEWFVKAQQMVRGPEEKRLLVSGLANLKHAEALRLIEGYLEDAEVQSEAQLSAIQIAENCKEIDKPVAKKLATKVRDAAKEPAIKQKAAAALRRIG